MCKRKLTIEQEIQLKEKYESGYQVKELMNIYGFKTKKSIYDIVTRRGGKMRTFQEALEVKNPRRKVSFKIIDEPFKAYFIGLMLTDGWVHKNQICLSMSKDFLEWCKRVFENHYNFAPLNLIQGENGIWNLRSSDERNMMLLYVHVYYSSFGMQRKYNKFVKRFREHNGRD